MVRICPNMVRICPNMSEYVRICPNMVRICPKMCYISPFRGTSRSSCVVGRVLHP